MSQLKQFLIAVFALVVLNLNANAEIIGAELAAQVVAPGKMQIILRTFHNDPSSAMATAESVTVFKSGLSSPWKIIQLEKSSQSNDIYPPPVSSSSNKISLPVISVIYTAMVDVPSGNAQYDVTWSFNGLNKIMNNVVLSPRQPIVLKATINDPLFSESNRLPMLQQLPALQLNSKSKTSFLLDIKEAGETDIVEVILSAPLAIQNQNSALAGSLNDFTVIQQTDYREGYSQENPLGTSLSFDKMSKEMVFDQPAPGNYLVTLTISDYRNRIALSNHQAFFFIESVL